MSKQLNDLKLNAIRSRRRYLNGKGWYCERLTRTTAAGSPILIPSEILTRMQLAADEINIVEVVTDYSELSTYSLGDYIIDTRKSIYKSLLNANQRPLDDNGTDWELVTLAMEFTE